MSMEIDELMIQDNEQQFVEGTRRNLLGRINIMLPRMRPTRRTKYIASGGILGFCGFVTLIVMAIGGTGSDSSTTSSKYCILYPRSSNTREILSLDGLWQFSLADHGNFDGPSPSGDKNDKDIMLIPVPSSYNDILTSREGRDKVGSVTYERTFLVPNSWRSSGKIWIRFGSVCYAAKVYINDVLVLKHEIGHLPFGTEITDHVLNGKNVIRVIVDNTLTDITIPQGTLHTLSSGRLKQSYTFDFFNYAGIDRPVVLYRTPDHFISDISIETDVVGTVGIVKYGVESKEHCNKYIVTVVDAANKEVATLESAEGSFKIENAHLWWPYLMHEQPGYMYTLRVQLLDDKFNEIDSYDQPFGIRKLTWDSKSFKVNGKPVYIRGVGKHEDSDFRGKGLDLPIIIKDHNLLRWLGVNAYRTSHYPYAEEIMDLADQYGIMIIDEVPAVDTEKFSYELLHNHKQALSELYNRDKNRPSVIMWSIANEPRTQYIASRNYYREVSSHIKGLDRTRPITIANNVGSGQDYSGQFLDILSFNSYPAWYANDGDLDTIKTSIIDSARQWHYAHNKPVLITEYGADTIEGFHSLPSFMWSEEFQDDFLSQYFEAFDELREQGWFIGEMVWNFADFKTPQGHTRVGGNKKGIFTRQRQPKSSAHLLRRRYWELARQMDNATVPRNLYNYVSSRKEEL